MLKNFTITRLYFLLLCLVTASLADAGTLYWVNNGGNWNDTHHWATISGGKGGAGIPTSGDDVVFDANSFDNIGEVVSITGTATCHTMQWTNTVYYPVLASSKTAALNIYGSLELSANLDMEFAGDIHFSSSQNNNVIDPSGKALLGNMYVEGSGSWALKSTLVLSNVLCIRSGNLNANGNTIGCDFLKIEGIGNKVLDISNSSIRINQFFDEKAAQNFVCKSNNTQIYYKHNINVTSLKDLNHSVKRAMACGGTIDSVHYTITDATCNHNDSGKTNNGRIIVTQIFPAGGGPYVYTWSNSGTNKTDSAINLSPGSYFVNISDTCGNVLYFGSFITITEPNGFNFAKVVLRNPTCPGQCDGEIGVELIGETPNYTYKWSTGLTGNAIGNPSNLFFVTNLCAGTYTIRMQDANKCVSKKPLTVKDPPGVEVTATFTPPLCNAGCNGTATATPSGGHGGSFTYKWLPGGQTTQTINGLCAGSYTVIAFDDSLCSDSAAVTVTQPPPITITPGQTNVSCNGACDGTATAVGGGGTAPYTYLWTPGGQTTTAVGPLCAGVYKIVVTDKNGCKDSTNITITQPPKLSVSITGVPNPLKCNGDCNAVLSTSVAGGTAPYTYKWSPGGQTTPTISNQCAGVFKVIVTDSHGCKDSATITITQPTPIVINITSAIPPTCNGSCNGSIVASVSGGTPAYTYKWSPGGQTTLNINNLCGGSYTLVVTDKNGCKDSNIVSIPNPLPISVVIKTAHVSCSGSCDGQAGATVSGGTAPYIYNWMPGITVFQGQGTDTIHSLCAGNDSLKITDANGCTQTVYFSITQPPPLTAVITSTTSSCLFCNGSGTVKASGGTPPYVYSWSPGGQTSDSAINLCVGTYTVTIKDADSCSVTKKVVIVPTVNITITTSSTSVSCFGSCDGTASANPAGGTAPYTYNWMPSAQTTQTATNLCGGITYTVTVVDVNGCTNTDSVTFINPPQLKDSVKFTNVSCNGSCDGTGTVYPYGGTSPYKYSWNTLPTQTTSSASGLCKGTYVVTITDANGCSTKDSVTITQATAIAANPTVTDATCLGNNGTISTAPTGGVGGYTYLWSPGGQTTQNIIGLTAGTYTVIITDSAGCSNTFIIPVNNTTGPTLSSKTINSLCWNTCTGYDSVIIVSGSGPFTYLWSPGGQTADSVINLCPGTYICTVTDKNGCVTNITNTITSPAAIKPNPTVKNITCNGLKNGSISFSPSGGTPAYTYVWSPAVSVGSFAAGLSAGTYTVTIGDKNGCDTVVDITITQPAVLTVSLSSTNVTCNGYCNGTATATVSGGTPGYIDLWSNLSSGTSAVNLCPGRDSVTVTDANGCSVTSAAVVITQPPVLKDSMQVIDISCNLGNTGTAIIFAYGGTPGYTYSWTPPVTTSDTAAGLATGTYYVTATDANGCQVNDSAKITQPPPITVVMSATNVTCNSSCNGTATATPAGGTPGYTYSWSPGGQTTQTATNLCPNTYTVTVTDKNGCTAQNNIAITEPAPLLAGASSNNTLCAKSCDGSASSSPTGGTSPYTYVWSTGATTSSVINLCAGVYKVVVTDKNGCKDSSNVTISNPTPITISSASIASSCAVCNGSINVSPSGGTGPYTYLWMPGGQTTPTASGLCAGIYTVTVTDAKGCDSSFTIILNTSGGPSSAIVKKANDSCNGLCDGFVIVTPIGGTAPYTYSWTTIPTQTSDTAKSLCIGSYSVTVTDNAGCTFFDTASITQPTALANTGVTTNAACVGKCTGTITLTTSGGTPPYKYSWSSGQTAQNLVNMCPGIYTVTITDANNCTLIQTDTVGQNTTITVPTTVTTPLLCNGSCIGKAKVTPSGGVSPYTFAWSNLENGQSDTLLCAGTYTITVTDINGCQGIDSAIITQPTAITITLKATPVTCNGSCDGKIVSTVSGGTPGYIYIWNTGSTIDSIINVCPGKDTVFVTDANGCKANDTLTIVNPPPFNESHVIGNASCNRSNDGSITTTVTGGVPGYTYSWAPGGSTTANLTNILPGTYTLTLTDATNCVITDIITVPADTTVIAEAGNDTSLCANASVTLNGNKSSNASSYQWFQLPSAVVIGTTPTITVTPPSGVTKYLLITLDGLCRDSDTVVVTVNPLPIINTGPVQTIFEGLSATIGGSPTGPAGSTYLWQPSSSLNDSALANPVATPTTTTTYTVTVTTPSGCTATDTITVIVLPQLVVPDGFTPNGDGTNDVWNLRNVTEFPGVVVEVFNRWGEQLFRSAGYKIPWDGTYNGSALPVGTYYYVINLNDPRFPKAYTGPVTIMR